MKNVSSETQTAKDVSRTLKCQWERQTDPKSIGKNDKAEALKR